jgi:hypothetical protein
MVFAAKFVVHFHKSALEGPEDLLSFCFWNNSIFRKKLSLRAEAKISQSFANGRSNPERLRSSTRRGARIVHCVVGLE